MGQEGSKGGTGHAKTSDRGRDEVDASKRDKSRDWPGGRSRGRQFRGRQMLTCGLEVKEMRGKLKRERM